MTNFLAETIEAIAASGHTPADIEFIGSVDSGHSCSWVQFQTLADFDYDPGFGAAYIGSDLRIVFKDGADMHRGEYDGSEWWEFTIPFVRPLIETTITTLFNGDMWPTVADQQKPGGKHG